MSLPIEVDQQQPEITKLRSLWRQQTSSIRSFESSAEHCRKLSE